jgi:membrane-associated protease RseP (regulator of RpoE activity)
MIGQDTLVLALLAVLGFPGLVLVHEAGHALMCVALGANVERLRVGGEPHLTIGRGPLRLELSLRQGEDEGFVEYSGWLSPRAVAAIALAGPAAQLLAVAALVVAAASTSDAVAVGLWVLASLGLVAAVDNLLPSEGNDGHVARCALTGVMPAAVADPVSIPPPAPRTRPAMRWPFALLLGAVCGLALVIGAPLIALSVVVLFGGVYLSQQA